MRFVVDPSVSLLRVNYPVDAIWRGVLAGDDAALAAVDLASGPVAMLVQRIALASKSLASTGRRFEITVR